METDVAVGLICLFACLVFVVYHRCKHCGKDGVKNGIDY